MCAALLILLAACNEDAVSGSDIAPSFTQNPATIFINELHYDNDGADTGEAVEVAGPAGTDLSGWSVALYNGTESQRSVYGTLELSGTIPDQDGGYGTLSFARAGIQNGSPDGLALVDSSGNLIQFLSYEGDFVAATGPAAGETSTDIGVEESSSTPVGFSLQLVGTGTTYQDFTWATPSDDSFGSVNSEQSFGGDGSGGDPGDPGDGGTGGNIGECSDDATLISAVQGSGEESPLVGETVTVEGVVVGDFQDDEVPFSDLGGFFVQEEADDADDNPATSEGVYVFAPGAADVSQGDVVRVSGTVGEFNGQTQLSDVTVQLCGTSPLPEPVDVILPLSSRDDLERLESMYVRFPQALVISEYFNYDRFGEIVLAQPLADLERPYQPTSYVEPGSSAATEIAELNDLSRITLDDGRSTQNPDPARHPNGEAFTLDNRFRGGDTVANAIGVLDYRFGIYRLQPTQGADYTNENPRPDAPEEVGGSLRVSSFNVLNYFTTFGERGADNGEEFERQRAKIIAALAEIDADIVGLVELENNGGSDNSAIQDLVNGLNDELGADTYDFIETGVIGTDAITVGMIYKPETVTLVGDFAVLDEPSFTDPNNSGQQKNRPALAQTFREEATGGVLTVVANHFKSKGSPCGEGDDDPQQGSCNDTRLKAADALAKWLAGDPTNSDDPDVLILGDLNAYDEEDPIGQLKAGADDTLGTDDDYTDLIEAFEGEFAYSFVFSGEFGHLDYALANEALLPQVTGTTEWHINADEPDLLDYDTSFKKDAQDALYEPNAYRSSDHDPVIVGLDLTPEVVDPAQAIPALIEKVQALRDGGVLNKGQANALSKKLEKSLKSLERKGAEKAIKDLDQFVKKVEAFKRGGQLPADVGDDLIADAREVIDALH